MLTYWPGRNESASRLSSSTVKASAVSEIARFEVTRPWCAEAPLDGVLLPALED